MTTARRLGRMAQYVSRQPGVAALAGIIVLAVPTLFGVFPKWGENASVPLKAAVLVGWVVAGAIIIARTITMEAAVERSASGLSEQELQFDVTVRMRTLSTLLQALFALPATSLPAEHHPQIFVPNAWRNRLVPWWDPEDIGPDEGWRIDRDPPQAVTGAAWATNDYVFAKGPAVSRAAYGLTAAQQARYDRLTGVSAMPVRTPDGRPVAVLTVCTESAEPRVSDRQFVDRQIALAVYLAPLLIGIGHLGRAD